jgi:hypothetical protein
MKIKIFALIIIWMISFNHLNSQIKFHAGFKGGLATSFQHVVYRWDAQGNYSTNNKLGFDAGLFLESSFGKIFSIQAEIHYVQKGWEEYGTSYLVKCLTLPLMMHFKMELGSFYPYILLGPRLDIILNHDSLNRLLSNMYYANFGLSMGFGCENNIIKKYSIILELRYDYDLNHDFGGGNVAGDITYYYGRSYAFFVGVKF